MTGQRVHAETEVRGHLERVLASDAFRKSHRASAMLRYTVESVLAGQSERLKERTIGVDVFGRPAGYDTAADHIVRSTAGDVRRRLAQYYQENEVEAALRISFAPGSYIPNFGNQRASTAEPPLARFWAPLLESERSVLLCIAGTGLAPVLADSVPAKSKDQLSLGEVFHLETEKVAYSDAAALATLAGFLSSHGARYQIARESDVGLDDLRRGPAVLIGALNNDWGVRLADDLRFTFRFDPAIGAASIADRGEPAWSIRLDLPFAAVREDRGLVTRVRNATTGQPMVVAGGLTMLGTLAAAALLTNPEYLPDGEWERPNAQIVFATTVLRGSPALPRVIDTWFW